MKRKLIAAVLLLPFLSSFSAKKNSAEIPWTASRKLTWSDFRSRPDNNSTNAALTSSKIAFNYSYGEVTGFSFTISCVFDKNSSWGRLKTVYILAHEQGHFDIAEIYARKLNKTLSHYVFNAATTPKEIPAIYQKLMKEEGEFQNQYDEETNFSRNKDIQARWLQKIREELDRLKEYAGYK
ncbi:MAG: DUF922 domain-containing protein [Bacteroidota bacterium]